MVIFQLYASTMLSTGEANIAYRSGLGSPGSGMGLNQFDAPVSTTPPGIVTFKNHVVLLRLRKGHRASDEVISGKYREPGKEEFFYSFPLHNINDERYRYGHGSPQGLTESEVCTSKEETKGVSKV